MQLWKLLEAYCGGMKLLVFYPCKTFLSILRAPLKPIQVALYSDGLTSTHLCWKQDQPAFGFNNFWNYVSQGTIGNTSGTLRHPYWTFRNTSGTLTLWNTFFGNYWEYFRNHFYGLSRSSRIQKLLPHSLEFNFTQHFLTGTCNPPFYNNRMSRITQKAWISLVAAD